jgi:hypothetical protein
MRSILAVTLTFAAATLACGGAAKAPATTDTAPAQPAATAPGQTADSHTDSAAMPGDATHQGAMGGQHASSLKTDVQLPDDVRAAWSGIRVKLVDSTTKAETTYDVPLGQTVALGDSGLTVEAETFVPDFVMDASGITTRSADPNNPAARVVIRENGADDYSGWLFANMPDIHPYPHEKYQVLLVDGIKSTR